MALVAKLSFLDGELVKDAQSDPRPVQNNVVKSIELQGNRRGSGKSPLNSRDYLIAFFAGGAPLMTVTVVN